MNRFSLAVLVVLIVATSAPADIAPPIPKGLKRVPASHRILTEKAFPDHDFFTVKVIESFRGTTREPASLVKLDPKTPVTLSTSTGASVSIKYELVAVPKGAAKKYDSDKDFTKAVADGKVPGLVKVVIAGGASADIKDSDPRKEVVREYKVAKIDPKEGIVFAADKKEPAPGSAPPKGEAPDSEELIDAGTAYTPRAGVWVAGLAATLAFVFAGLWFVGRSRRG